MLAIMLNSMRLRKKKKIINEKKKDMVCCRTCLSTDELHPIFSEKGAQLKRSEELRLITGLEIKANDGLPQKICTKCLELLNEAIKFRRTSEKASETLLSLGYRRRTLAKKETLSQKYIKQEVKVDGSSTEHDMNDHSYDDAIYNNDDFHQYDDIPKNKDLKRKTAKFLKQNTIYRCNMCNKEFKLKTTFRAHMRFHTNYCVCELCGKKCRNNNLLLLHKRGLHGMERIHKCAYCDYSSANKEGLIIHERRHTGEKPYICDHCGASFHRRSNLVQHIAIHLPEKNFQCNICLKRLKSRKFLQIHKHNVHTGRRYAYLCPLCARRFEKPNKVRAHLRAAHAVHEPQQHVQRVELWK